MAEHRLKNDLRGCAALVTGGSRGLGLEIARQLVREGARVALLARGEAELAEAKNQLVTHGGDILTVPADLLDSAQLVTAFQRVVAHFGRLDLLVNNAGIIEVGPLRHMQWEDFDKSMNLHFWASFNLIWLALPQMRQQGGGRIVNVTSIGGKMAVPHMVPYCASKSALVGLSEALRTELLADNIFVTTVVPGLMRTGSFVHAKFKGRHREEYDAFSLAATAPIISINSRRAAARIVKAARKRKPLLITPLMTRLTLLGYQTFPNVSAHLAGFISRFLPTSTDASGDKLKTGSEL